MSARPTARPDRSDERVDEPDEAVLGPQVAIPGPGSRPHPSMSGYGNAAGSSSAVRMGSPAAPRRLDPCASSPCCPRRPRSSSPSASATSWSVGRTSATTRRRPLAVPVMTADVGAESGASEPPHPRPRPRSAPRRLGHLSARCEAALADAHPDLILTQELCDVCAVSYREVTEAVRRIDAEISVVSLEPRSIEGILNTISTVGAMADAEDEAVGLIEILRERLGAIENRVLERRLAGVAPRRVVCLEWLDPPFAAGHWVPEQVRRAGGWELLGREGERSMETTWQAVREVDPEQLLLIPCGLDAEATRAEWARTPKPDWFDDAARRPRGRGPRARRLGLLQPAWTAGRSMASACWPRSWTPRGSSTRRRRMAGSRSRSEHRSAPADALPDPLQLPVVRTRLGDARPGRPRGLGAALPRLRRRGRRRRLPADAVALGAGRAGGRERGRRPCAIDRPRARRSAREPSAARSDGRTADDADARLLPRSGVDLRRLVPATRRLRPRRRSTTWPGRWTSTPPRSGSTGCR